MKSLTTIKRFFFILLLILFLGIYPVKSAYSQFSCLPTCDVTDTKMFSLAGPGQISLVTNNMTFSVISPAADPTVTIGIFDGDTSNDNWDILTIELKVTVYADPAGDGSGAIMIGQWTGDGSSGDNIGDPMVNNDWYDITFPNSVDAQTIHGTYRYFVVIDEITPPPPNGTVNSFKVRSDGALVLFPLTQPFGFSSRAASLDDFFIMFPNLDLGDPDCFDGACSIGDPDCCWTPTSYDGNWQFCFSIGPDATEISLWDGDMDFGASFAPIPCVGNPDIVDTDDPNTSNIGVPSFAVGSEAMPEGAAGANPFDNNCGTVFPRGESVTYNLTSPSGQVFENSNPSGNQEWELFLLSEAPFDPTIMDYHVDDIESGTWCMNVLGMDIINFNSLRFNDNLPICGVDPMGTPVCSQVVLDVTIIGNGDGRVDSTNPGITCSSTGDNDCDEQYDRGAQVTLTAMPDPGSYFVGWSGDDVCSGDPTNPVLNLDMTMDISCIAEFELLEFVLNPIFPALDDNINFISAENSYPNGNVAFIWGKKPGQFSLGGRICNGAMFGINNPKLLAIERANEFGVSTYIFYIPLFSDFEFSIQLQALDIQTCRTSNQIDQIIRKEEGG